MEQESSLLSTLKSLVAYILLFAFPLFFLPITQEYFMTNKVYFLLFGGLSLLILSVLEFALTKKLHWKKGHFDTTLILFFITAVLSVVMSSPNKVQALLQPIMGIVPLFGFLVLYFFLSRSKNEAVKTSAVYISSLAIAAISIFYFFDPLKNIKVPAFWEFLKNPYFSPLGSQLDSVYLLGFAAVLAIAQIFSKRAKNNILPLVTLVFSLTAAALLVFSWIRTPNALVLPPFNLSWYGAVETLKQPVTALFGVGIDNYGAMFTRVKDATYNASSIWQIGSFNAARSTFLHILTEMGVFGFVAFCLLMIQLFRSAIEAKHVHGNRYAVLPFAYVFVLTLFFPPSLTVLFILFLMVIGVGVHDKTAHAEGNHSFDTGKVLPLYATMLVLALLFIGATGYLGGRAYASEISFKQALNAYGASDVKNVYENMRRAIIANPYIERNRTNFAQVNMLIANNIASKLTQQPKEGEAKPELTEEEKQTVAQALQAAIEESKAVVTLNPQKAANWDNLAGIYRNIINVAEGADSWTVSAYQRAIVLDPQNPVYRVSLGGIMFSFKNYDEAYKLFEQAVSIKPDWSNAYYNLAWAAYQKEDYQTAAAAMQSAVSLLDPKQDEADYKRAISELEEFKKKLPEDATATGEAQQQSSKLSVPTPPVQTPLEDPIKLPKEASPEAK